MKNLAGIVLLALALVVSGCASVTRGDEQKIRINTFDFKTNKGVSANCTVTNDEGSYRASNDKIVYVGRDKDPLQVKCENETLQGEVVVDGHVNYGFTAVDFFLLDLCLVSCWIDGLTGSWAEYQSMIDVPMQPKKPCPN